MFINITVNNYFEKKEVSRYIYEIIVTYEIRIPQSISPIESLHLMFLRNMHLLIFQGEDFLNYSLNCRVFKYNFTQNKKH